MSTPTAEIDKVDLDVDENKDDDDDDSSAKLIIIPGEWPSGEILAAKMKSFAETCAQKEGRTEDEREEQTKTIEAVVVFPSRFRLPAEFRSSIFGKFFRTIPVHEENEHGYHNLHSTDSDFIKDGVLYNPYCRAFLFDKEGELDYIKMMVLEIGQGQNDSPLKLNSHSAL